MPERFFELPRKIALAVETYLECYGGDAPLRVVSHKECRTAQAHKTYVFSSRHFYRPLQFAVQISAAHADGAQESFNAER